jgi:hypothetical protein
LVTAGLVLGQLREMQRVYAPIAEQARYTRESYVAVQRAFVSDARLELVKQTSSDWVPKVTVRNSGGSPTKGAEYVAVYTATGAKVRDPESWFGTPTDVWRITAGSMTIGAQGTSEVLLPAVTFRPLESEPRSTGEQKKSWFFAPLGTLVGAIRYHDHFSSTETHVTKFCFWIWATTSDAAPEIPADNLVYAMSCPYWNCSDEDCESDRKAYEEKQKIGKTPF